MVINTPLQAYGDSRPAPWWYYLGMAAIGVFVYTKVAKKMGYL